MKKLVFILSFATISFTAAGQSLERQVIGAAGVAVQNNNAGLSQTVGEAATTTGSSGSVVLTQGFQQPDDQEFISVFDVQESDISILVFPNPATDILKLSSNLFQSGIYKLKYVMYDMHGKVVMQGTVNAGMDEIQVSDLASSTYTISLSSEDLSFSHISRFVKL